MAIRPIRTVPDPVLRQKARKVRTVDARLHKLIEDMRETCKAAGGVGLAAPQVGEPVRIICLAIPKKDQPDLEYVLVNPEVVRTTGERTVKEACLSIPGYVGEITRSQQVRVKATDPQGKEVKIRAQGLLAQALEHEIDHLNGVLYVDHLESQDKLQKAEPPREQKPEEEPATEFKS
jgi:peptide deformylase